MRKRTVVLVVTAVVVLGYSLTWLLGVPVVVSDVATKRLRDVDWLIRKEGPDLPQHDGYPWFRVGLVFPVVPGVVFISHSGEAYALGGYGQWALYLWYGKGVRVLVERETWVS